MNKSEIKTRIKQINGELEIILQSERKIKNTQYDQWIKDLIIDMLDNGVADWPWAKLIDCVNRKALNKEKVRLSFILTPTPLPEGNIGPKEIQRAKDVPMSQLLEFNRLGVTKCLWHDDKNPSMRWFKKNNKVKCFACGKTGDTVDVVMKLYNLNLPQAVKRILNV